MATTTVGAAALRPPVPTRVLLALTIGLVLSLALVPLKVDQAFGMPAHPLLIHLPVILDPFVALSTVVLLIRPALRARFGLVLGGLAVLAAVATAVAVGAGNAFADGRPFLDETLGDHKAAGELLRIVAFAVAGLVLAVLWRDHCRPAFGGRALATTGLVISIVLAVGLGFMTIRTGHLGAQAVWDEPAGGGMPPAGFMPPGG